MKMRIESRVACFPRQLMLQLVHSPMRIRMLVSLLVGIIGGLYCWFLLAHLHLGAADFGSAIRAARALLAHQNPYAAKLQLYPLPAALFGLPFVALRPEIAAGIFYGLSSGLLAFGLIPSGYNRLLIFLAYPYWAGLLNAQWSPLLMASASLPWLMPSVLAKPQIGLPIAITHLKRSGILLCGAVLLLTVLLIPSWPIQWEAHFHAYQHFTPILVLPGPFLVLAFFRYRDRDAWLLLLASMMPQRWFYDAFILWLIPKSRREIIWTASLSWGAGILRWYYMPQNIAQVGRCVVIFFYLPLLMVILARKNPKPLVACGP